MNQLNDLINFYARSLLLNKNFYDFCSLTGVRFSDWPEGQPKKVAQAYELLRKTCDHEPAAVQLSGYLDGLDSGPRFPRDEALLRALYDATIYEYRVKKLCLSLQDDPMGAEKYISAFSQAVAPDDLLKHQEQVESVFKESVLLHEEGEAIRSIPDWPILSDLVGGFNPGRVGMLLAQTGFGKTTAAVNLALCAASKMNVIYFNMEMLEQDFGEKLLLAELKESFKTLKNAPLSLVNKLAEALPRIYPKNLLYSKGRAMSPHQIFATCRRENSKSGVDFVIVDYDQKLIMDTSREVPEWKALQIAIEQFEALAKELNCFVLMLAQESGDGEISGSKRSKFPASTVLRFYKTDDGKYLIQAVKNRFGRYNAAVEVHYESEKSTVTEQREYLEIPRKRESSLVRYPS